MIKRVIFEYNCYRCKKQVKLTREENQPGRLYDIEWINYKDGYGHLCIACTLNKEEFLGVGPYESKDLIANG
jgi:hypothetical protein